MGVKYFLRFFGMVLHFDVESIFWEKYNRVQLFVKFCVYVFYLTYLNSLF